MPLHMESLINKDDSRILEWILQSQFNDCDDAFATKEKMCAHVSKDITDEISHNKIGELVFTIKINSEKKAYEIVDIDITLKNPSNTQIKFTKKLRSVYYDAETKEDAHLQTEIVNYYLIEEDPEGNEYDVNISAFPFQLSVYDNINAFNAEMGFSNEVRVGETDYTVAGFSEHFIAPSEVFKEDKNSDETFSFVVGIITKLQNCRIKMNNESYDIIIAQLDTAVGNLTTAINTERYYTEGIREGKLIAMKADLKVNFKLNDKYPQH